MPELRTIIHYNHLDRLAHGEEVMAEALRETREEEVRIAKQLVPVRTGATRDSIRIEGDSVVSGEATIYVELGTRHRAARPFRIPAFNRAVEGLSERARRKMLARIR